jgi:hypothetical protein
MWDACVRARSEKHALGLEFNEPACAVRGWLSVTYLQNERVERANALKEKELDDESPIIRRRAKRCRLFPFRS